jgi:hypothetical protein
MVRDRVVLSVSVTLAGLAATTTCSTPEDQGKSRSARHSFGWLASRPERHGERILVPVADDWGDATRRAKAALVSTTVPNAARRRLVVRRPRTSATASVVAPVSTGWPVGRTAPTRRVSDRDTLGYCAERRKRGQAVSPGPAAGPAWAGPSRSACAAGGAPLPDSLSAVRRHGARRGSPP